MAKKVQESAQAALMQRIKDSLPGNISLVEELADLLQISNDSAYRRMRGETALSIEEITVICKHFKISFDAFTNAGDNSLVTFSYLQLNSQVNSYKDYLNNINGALLQIASFPEKLFIYAAEDVPLFQHFAHRELTAFKFFYWNKSILNDKDLADKKFDFSLINPELFDIADSIVETYSKIPAIEIWSDDTVNSTIKQIEFYWDSGNFKSREDALLICKQVGEMLERIKKQAEQNSRLGTKSDNPNEPSNYTLYHSEVMIGNNCILIQMGNTKVSYLSYHTFNAMYTTNANFCNETDLWLKNLIRKSNLISGVGEKNRYRYFKRIEDMLKKLVHKIEQD